PAVLGIGAMEPDRASPWWRTRELLTLVERDFAKLGPLVRASWEPFENALVEEAARVEAEAASARRAGHGDAAPAVLSAFTARAVDEFLGRLDGLLHELSTTR